MPKIPRISGAEAVKAFMKIGYNSVRQRGSHIRLLHNDPRRLPLTIPNHKELGIGLLRKLLRNAQMTVDELIELLR